MDHLLSKENWKLLLVSISYGRLTLKSSVRFIYMGL